MSRRTGCLAGPGSGNGASPAGSSRPTRGQGSANWARVLRRCALRLDPESQRAHALSYAPALIDAELDSGPEVDASVEAREGGLLRCLEKRAERARRQPAAVVGVVGEGHLTEQVREHLGRGARLYRVAGGVFGERRGAEDRQPGRVEPSLDVGHGPE